MSLIWTRPLVALGNTNGYLKSITTQLHVMFMGLSSVAFSTVCVITETLIRVPYVNMYIGTYFRSCREVFIGTNYRSLLVGAEKSL